MSRGKAVAVVVALVLGGVAWACSGTGDGPHERECTGGLDEDGDGLADCYDPDCAGFAVCAADGDADADTDVDTDSDSDADADSDSDDDGPAHCPLACPQAGQGPLLDVCEWGDCYESGERGQCCVAEETLCHTVLTVGDLYEDLDVSWRGLYDDDHDCMVRIVGEDFLFSAQTRGEACRYGFIRIQVRGVISALTPGAEYQLCDDPGLAPRDLTVNLFVGMSGSDQVNYTNQGCPGPGTFTLTAMGSETGEGYEFALEGTLSEVDTVGEPTGRTMSLAVDSEGIVWVEAGG
jgi:hypothetical protein